MSYLLLIFYFGHNAVAIDTLEVESLEKCNKLGHAVTEIIDDKDIKIGQNAGFRCIPLK